MAKAVSRYGITDDTTVAALVFDSVDPLWPTSFITQRFNAKCAGFLRHECAIAAGKINFVAPTAKELEQSGAMDGSKDSKDDDGSKDDNESKDGYSKEVEEFSKHSGSAWFDDSMAAGEVLAHASQSSRSPVGSLLRRASVRADAGVVLFEEKDTGHHLQTSASISRLANQVRRMSKVFSSTAVHNVGGEIKDGSNGGSFLGSLHLGDAGTSEHAPSSPGHQVPRLGSLLDPILRVQRKSMFASHDEYVGRNTLRRSLLGDAATEGGSEDEEPPDPLMLSFVGRRKPSASEAKSTRSNFSLQPAELTLWGDRERARVIDWTVLQSQATTMELLGQGEFAKVFTTSLEGEGEVCAMLLQRESSQSCANRVVPPSRSISVLSPSCLCAIADSARAAPGVVLSVLPIPFPPGCCQGAQEGEARGHARRAWPQARDHDSLDL